MQKEPEFIYLQQEDVLATGYGMKDAMDTVAEALALHSQGKTNLPSKGILDMDERKHGRINSMSAYVGGDFHVCGIKWIAGFPNNPRKYGIPRAHAVIILNDAETGVPIAIMDGTYLSALRTGAATGVGIIHLAKKDSKTLGIIGCGLQARTQLMAVMEARPSINTVKAFDISKENAEKYCRWASDEFGVKAIVTGSEKEAVSDADIIITITVGDAPMVKADWVKEGCLFVHCGSYQEEEDAVVLKADKRVVDDWVEVKHRRTPTMARLAEAGQLTDDDIWAELGEIVAGSKKGRENDQERIYFAPLGLAIDDVSVAAAVYRKALEKNVGQKLKLWSSLIPWMKP